jgi:quinolinate synthase
MAMNAVAGVIDCLERGSGEITVPELVRTRALVPVERMLAFAAAHPESIVAAYRGHVPHLGSA